MRKTVVAILPILAFFVWYGFKLYNSREILFGPSCEEVIEPALTKVFYEDLEADNFYSWVIENYSIDQSYITAYDESGNKPDFSWVFDKKTYSAYFEKGRLISVAVERLKAPDIDGDKIIECFGPPDHYLAYQKKTDLGYTHFELQLWLPDKGLIARSASLDMNTTTVRVPSVKTLPLTLFFFQPGTIESMSSDVRFTDLPSEKQIRVKPWPGTWSAVSFELLP